MQITRKRALRNAAFATGLLPLAALGLAIPAQAQQTLNLQSGDSVTVSSAGTTGTYQGQPISDSTIGYYTTTVGASAVTTVPGSALTLADGGGVNADGGYGIDAEGGVVHVTGGQTFGGSYFVGPGAGMRIGGGSDVTISGGQITSDGLGMEIDSGTVTITGGDIRANRSSGSGIMVNGGSVFINGGTFTGEAVILGAIGGNVYITGGIFQGGVISANGGTIDLFGTGFNDGNGHTYNAGDKITNNDSDLIKGILADGQAFSKEYIIDAGGSGGVIEFNVPIPAPEPSPSTALTLGSLILAGLVLRGRRRQLSH